MRNYLQLNRLNESHDAPHTQMPPEILDMTVGEMLDRIEQNDTDEDNRYEMIEDSILSCMDCLIGSGYDSDQQYSEFGSVEGEFELGDDSKDDYTDSEYDGDTDFPSYSDMEGSQEGAGSLEDFNF